MSGELSVETPDRVHTVPAGQFFVPEPELPHRAHVGADAEGSATVIGIGAPPVSDGYAVES